MSRSTVPLGRMLGIPIALDFSWFLIATLLTWSFAVDYYPAHYAHWSPALYWIMGVITALMLFASVLLHELGHSVIAQRCGVPVRSITLFLFGGIAEIASEPPSARAEFRIAIAGPLVSLLLAVLFTSVQPLVAGSEPMMGLASYLAVINMGLVLFNLIPGYPLDGGRVFRAILWGATGNLRRATLIAANAGRFFAFALIGIGVLLIYHNDLGDGIWIAFIGWFLDNTASSKVQQVQLQGLLAGHQVAQAMNPHPALLSAEIDLQQLVDEHILGQGQRCFLIQRQDQIIGMMTIHRLREVPRSAWATTTTAQAMIPLDQLKRLERTTDLWLALQELDRDGVDQLPVTSQDRIIGMLSRSDVISYLRTLQDVHA